MPEEETDRRINPHLRTRLRGVSVDRLSGFPEGLRRPFYLEVIWDFGPWGEDVADDFVFLERVGCGCCSGRDGCGHC